MCNAAMMRPEISQAHCRHGSAGRGARGNNRGPLESQRLADRNGEEKGSRRGCLAREGATGEANTRGEDYSVHANKNLNWVNSGLGHERGFAVEQCHGSRIDQFPGVMQPKTGLRSASKLGLGPIQGG